MTTIEDDSVDLLSDLVAIESVNPDLAPGGSGEATIARYVADWARASGLGVEIFDADLTETEASNVGAQYLPRPSVLVRSAGHAAAPTLLLCGHLDTVGLGAMSDPLEPRIAGERMFGRGTYDMKAGLAATLLACREVSRRALPVNVIVAAVADEEFASAGVQRVLREVSADAAIVTEPTELAVGVAHQGFVWVEITVHGQAAHGSRPELGIDAIVKAAPVLSGIERLGRRLATRPHPLLGPGSIHASLITGGQEPSTIPDRCTITVERRTLPGETAADVEREINDLLTESAQADPDFHATARVTMHRPALDTPADSPLVASLAAAHQAVCGNAAEVTGMSYWADSAFLAAAGIPTVLYGPGGDGAHAEVEWVHLPDVAACVRVLVDTARRLAARNVSGS